MSEPNPEKVPLYVFLTRRPQDKQPWPCVYQDLKLAVDAPHRVSLVYTVVATVLRDPQP